MNSFDLAKQRHKKIAAVREHERRTRKIKNQFKRDDTFEKVYGKPLSYMRQNGQVKAKQRQKEREEKSLRENAVLLPAVTSLTSEHFNRRDLGRQSQLLRRGADIEREKKSTDTAFARRALRTQQQRRFSSQRRSPSPTELIQQGKRPSSALSSSFAFQSKQKDLNKIIKVIKDQGIDVKTTSNTDIIRAATQYLREIGKLDHDGIAFVNNIACLLEPSFWSEAIPYRIRGSSLTMKDLTHYLESFGVIIANSDGKASESKEPNLQSSNSRESINYETIQTQNQKGQSGEVISTAPRHSETKSHNVAMPEGRSASAGGTDEGKQNQRKNFSAEPSTNIFPEETHYQGVCAPQTGIAFRSRKKDDELYTWRDTRRSVASLSSKGHRGGGAINNDEALWRTSVKKALETTVSTDDTPFHYYFENGYLERHDDRQMDAAIRELPMETSRPKAEPQPRASLKYQENKIFTGNKRPVTSGGGSTVSGEWGKKTKESAGADDPLEKRATSRRCSQTDHRDFQLILPRTMPNRGDDPPSLLQRTLRESARRSQCSSAKLSNPRYLTSQQSSSRPQSASSIGMRPASVSSAMRSTSSPSGNRSCGRPQSAFSTSSQDLGKRTNRPGSGFSGVSTARFAGGSSPSGQRDENSTISKSGIGADNRPVSSTSIGIVSIRSSESASSMRK